MKKEHMSNEEKKSKVHKQQSKSRDKDHAAGADSQAPLSNLQQQVGNRAVQRLLAQRSGEGAFELDDETAERINRERGGGQPLKSGVQEEMSAATGQDFSDVTVHTSQEADELNQDLGAKAFTTGKDIFFRDGEYDPHSSDGQELIAHELTHVAQQGTGKVDTGGQMKVNAPGDTFEHEADDVAKQVVGPNGADTTAQRQVEEEDVQTQAAEEEEELQMQAVEEEEEELQMQPVEEEEELQMQPVEEEEEELQMQAVEEEEEELPA